MNVVVIEAVALEELAVEVVVVVVAVEDELVVEVVIEVSSRGKISIICSICV